MVKRNETLPKYLIVHKIEIDDAKSMVVKFNELFVNSGANLANKIHQKDPNFGVVSSFSQYNVKQLSSLINNNSKLPKNFT